MKVGEAMTRGVEFVPATGTVREAAVAMAEHDVGAVLVGAPDRLEGILTDRDIIIRAVVAGRDPATVAAGEVMSSTVHTCGPDQPVGEALAEMEERQVRRLPVVDAAGVVVGIVVRRDLERAAAGTAPAAGSEPGPA